MSKRVAMLVGDFVDHHEAARPYDELRQLGVQVDVISPGRKPGEHVFTAVHDHLPEVAAYVETSKGRFTVTTAFEQACELDYDALLVPGGQLSDNLRQDLSITRMAQRLAMAACIAAATADGVHALAQTSVLEGRRVGAYLGGPAGIEKAGATWVYTASDGVCEDGRFI
jgi:protease I